MSRFFDLLQRLGHQTDTSSSVPRGLVSPTVASDEFDSALSLLLPAGTDNSPEKENSIEPSGLVPFLSAQDKGCFENFGRTPDALDVKTEEVHLNPASRIVFQTDPRSPGSNRFRLLRLRLRELWKARTGNTLLITSPLPEDGKSTVALNLATALAEGGKRSVLLVEADLHRSNLTQHLNLIARPGLGECLERGLSPLSAVRRLEPLGWCFLGAGEVEGNATELLQSDTLSVIMQKLSPHFDWILIDSPPVTPLTDALSLARQANGTLLIARAGRTPSEAIDRAITLLGRQHIVGVVLNGVEELDRVYSGYYGYSSAKSPEMM